ncbi:MAG: N-acyl-D-amino-acid deacylase family protein [Stackebrandtia sp.]
MNHDLVLRGGTILDGSGAAGRVADVAVSDGRVAEIGRLSTTSARRVLDVDGAVVCPGFIDLHSHADFTVFSAPDAVTQTTQGVTTLVTGNCGMSPFPVVAEHADELRQRAFLDHGLTWEWSTAGEYADAVDRLPLGVNLALQVGHGSLRTAGMGSADRAPTAEELERMRLLLRQSAAEGAVGFSSGLIYAPGRYAEIDELVALAAEAAAAGLLYSTHMRDEGDRLLESVDESLEVARRSGARLEISHLKAAGPENWGRTAEALAAIEAARDDGVDVCADQYPYTASSTSLTSWLPGWALDGGTAALVARLDDPATARRIAAEIPKVNRTLHPDRIVVANTPEGPCRRFVGVSIAEAGDELGLDGPHAIVELLRAQRAHVHIIHHGMSEEEVRSVMRHESVSVASDGSAVACPGRGRSHPRSLGTFTRVLGRYVREEGVLALPEAVRKMTSLPASRLGWSDRGTLRPGAIADVAVFDPHAVADKATFADPWQLSEGVVHTLLDGHTVLESGKPTGTPAGRVVR